ncbi:hypothetical protein JCM11641_004067 [Rhodosporidiobolus odoratus]
MTARSMSTLLRTSLRAPLHSLRPTAPRPSPSALRHSPSSSRTLSTSLPSRGEILDQTPHPVVHPAPIPPAPTSQAKEVPKRRSVRARKAALSLSPQAVTRIQSLLAEPTPKLIRIGVRNKGCAGMSYHLEYVDKPEKFDEVVEQDGVKVVIDSKALFSIIGSEMDWKEDALQARFVFNNPNIKDACGCGESFIV